MALGSTKPAQRFQRAQRGNPGMMPPCQPQCRSTQTQMAVMFWGLSEPHPEVLETECCILGARSFQGPQMSLNPAEGTESGAAQVVQMGCPQWSPMGTTGWGHLGGSNPRRAQSFGHISACCVPPFLPSQQITPGTVEMVKDRLVGLQLGGRKERKANHSSRRSSFS